MLGGSEHFVHRWSAIAAQLPKRTDNEIKNYWNTHLKKRLTRMGIDPTTHKPKTDALVGSGCTSHSKDAANLSHMAQWESARLEAEARLVRESKLQVQNQQQLGSTSSTQPARLVLNKITAQQPSLPPCLDVLKAWQNSWSPKPQPSPTTSTTKDNNKMHSMYAMMLSTDDNLESPTSTLCFPGSIMPPMASSTTTTVGVLNGNLLPLTNTNEFSKSSGLAPCEGVFMKGASSGSESSWGYLTKQQNPEAELGGDEERVDNNNNNNNNLRDDDIMMAVEAFRSAGAYDSVNVPPLSTTTSDVVVMGGLNNDAMVYDSNDSLPIINGDGSMCNVSLEENKHYWNTILNLVNDAQVMF